MKLISYDEYYIRNVYFSIIELNMLVGISGWSPACRVICDLWSRWSVLVSCIILVDVLAHYFQDALDLRRLGFAVGTGEGSAVASELCEVVVLVYAVAPDAVGVVGGHLEGVGNLRVRLLFRPPLIWAVDLFVGWVCRTWEPDPSISLHHLDLWVEHGRGCGARNGCIPDLALPCLHQVDRAWQVGILGGERTAGLL